MLEIMTKINKKKETRNIPISELDYADIESEALKLGFDSVTDYLIDIHQRSLSNSAPHGVLPDEIDIREIGTTF